MSNKSKIKIAIIGASGYTGAELVRLLYNHENAEIVALAAEKSAGNQMGDIYTHFRSYNLPKIIKISEINFKNVDVVFCCLPHGTSQEVIKSLPCDIKIIDLSADFRLYNVDLYEKWYGHAHQAPTLQKEVVYGLAEINRDKIKKARLVANPGCYPTTAALPLIPLLQDKIISVEGIIIDSKSGVTGAGRSEKMGNLYCEVNDNMKPYGVCNHRHMPEIEQTLSIASGEEVLVNFTPQLAPMSRGILSTIYIHLKPGKTIDGVSKSLQSRYKNEEFVQVLANGQLPSTRDTYATNKCIIGFTKARSKDMVVIASAIDNLCKGASGQAVQNMNIMFGLKESCGLNLLPVFP